jgi:hypothetical protein
MTCLGGALRGAGGGAKVVHVSRRIIPSLSRRLRNRITFVFSQFHASAMNLMEAVNWPRFNDTVSAPTLMLVSS